MCPDIRSCCKRPEKFKIISATVDARNPANQLRLVGYPIIYEVFLHPRWCRISSINSMSLRKRESVEQRSSRLFFCGKRS